MSTIRESMALAAGSSVGRYRIEALQGTWGFCLTYAATDAAGAPVLLHELLPEELVQRAADGAVAAPT